MTEQEILDKEISKIKENKISLSHKIDYKFTSPQKLIIADDYYLVKQENSFYICSAIDKEKYGEDVTLYNNSVEVPIIIKDKFHISLSLVSLILGCLTINMLSLVFSEQKINTLIISLLGDITLFGIFRVLYIHYRNLLSKDLHLPSNKDFIIYKKEVKH